MTIDKQIEREARAIEYKQEVDLYSDLYEGLVGYEYAYDLMVSLKIEAYKNGYNKALHSSRWRKVSEELPPEGEEVLFFHEDWIDEDFNPKGIRIGFYESDDYTTAKWWSIQDCYMTISHSECDDNPSFSDKTRNSIEPQRWKPID